MTSHSGKYRKDIQLRDGKKFKEGTHRACASYCAKYVGKPIYGCNELTLPIDKLRYNKAMEKQLSLF